MPPTSKNLPTRTTPHIEPARSPMWDMFVYALPRFSDLLRRSTDIKNGWNAGRLKMSPVVGLWLTVAFFGVLISTNSYFMNAQHLIGADAYATVIPIGRDDVAFTPMALFPPVLLWLSKVVNFCSWAVGLIIPDLPFSGGAHPTWNPAARATIWSSATLALAWWGSFLISVLISATQGLFTRTVPLSAQRQYAARLNKIARIDLNPKAIAPAKRAVRQANNYGTGSMWLMVVVAVGGWILEFNLADGALAGSSFNENTRWIYGIASTFLAEVGWFVAQNAGKTIDPDQL